MRDGDKATPALSSAKETYWRAKGQREELRAQQESGQMVPVQDAMRLWSEVIRTVSNRLEGLPRKVSPLLVGLRAGEIEAELTRQIDAIRRECTEPDLVQQAAERAFDDEVNEVDRHSGPIRRKTKKAAKVRRNPGK